MVSTSVQLSAAADILEEGARSGATRRSYAVAWGRFSGWCEAHGYPTLPASSETVRWYLSDHQEVLAPATLARHLVAISQVHQDAGHETPTRSNAVRKVMSGIRRKHGAAPDAKAPLLVDALKTIIENLPPNGGLCASRDRALLLLGWAGGMRRAEIVGLDVADIQETRDGLIVLIRKSKTDQTSEGHKIGIPRGEKDSTCPVAAFRDWLSAAEIREGPVFRPIDRHGNLGKSRLSGDSVARIVKAHALRVGLDPLLYAGHSLRAGMVTSLATQGVPERLLQKQTRHKSVTMLRRYIRDGELFRENALNGCGL